MCPTVVMRCLGYKPPEVYQHKELAWEPKKSLWPQQLVIEVVSRELTHYRSPKQTVVFDPVGSI